MTMDSEYPQDEKTVLLDRQGRAPAQAAVTDYPSPPRFEQLEDRMIYTASLQGAQGFKMGPNALVAAAWDLLSQVVELRSSTARESLQSLNDRLSSAITAFEAHALHQGVANSQVMSARYVLCSVIDEAVVTTAWGSRSHWSKTSLLSRFHNETFGGEKFFQLLERLSRDPVKHVAMLELMYLCLSMGFEGKYRVMERGPPAIPAQQAATVELLMVITVVVLQVLRTQQHALPPDDFINLHFSSPTGRLEGRQREPPTRQVTTARASVAAG
ncbi:type IV/VI secretion system protein, DotU family [Pseudomonas sp. 31 E 6]|uniref:type IVB secretion system protein IcmH/DotU n=1 Tax=unclassified Pseudomonas TaxID=196821 RepID=UPI0008128A1B|nr:MULTISPECIES: type IVB secretion system protein IcmH/DotU [unclassified Pseudomonas]CRM42706.1 type IV/VI secretion system protein, DotU family [Pseudomonas sp. 31 E 5]CRM62503.1 type IV/VI secretion system protein, DotU family [Pseudomonas sp. 31 E 6]